MKYINHSGNMQNNAMKLSSQLLTFVAVPVHHQEVIPSLSAQLQSETPDWPFSAMPACLVKQQTFTLSHGLRVQYGR